MKEVILADKAGFCFGVKRAVDKTMELKRKYNKPIYTLGPLIHNNDVVEELEKNEIFSIGVDDIEKLNPGDVIVIRSHGVSSFLIDKLKKLNLIIENATCPYVSNIQQKVEEHYNKGYNIIIVGDENHPEVIGINGWCDNTALISKDGNNIKDISRKVCVVSQTTEKQENWQKVLNKIITLSKEIVAFNTICSATEVRQKAAEEISKEVDVMVVLGGFNSSNTTKLYEICKSNCSNTHHVEKFDNTLLNLIKGDDTIKIGVTAGASTPDSVIKEAINKMKIDKNLNNEEMELYNQYSKDANNISVGKILEGEVFKINDNEAYLTIGSKTEAILPASEFLMDKNSSLKDMIKIGDMIKAKVINRKNDDGLVVLSNIELDREKNQELLKQAFENKEIVEVVVKEVVKGGLVSTFKRERVFIPASQIELTKIEDLSKYVGETFKVQIIEFSKQRNGFKIIGSRRELLSKDMELTRAKTWEKLEKDQVVEGIVRRISSFGAFVEIDGVDGLLHSSEMSWNKVNNPSKLYKIGDKIEVLIIDLDKENNKLALSVKQLSDNPWNNIQEKYPIGNIVLGKVVRIAEFGAFIQLEEGIDGLVHISQISDARVEKVEEALKIGQEVKAIILDVNEESKRIGLSIKAV